MLVMDLFKSVMSFYLHLLKNNISLNMLKKMVTFSLEKIKFPFCK